MNWITILWSMIAGACLTLAAFYFVVWLKQRENWVHLLFSSSAVAAATIAGFELAMIHAKTVGQYEALVRWIHVPALGQITFEDLMSRWHPDDRENVRQALKQAIENGKGYRAEFRIVLADAGVRWISARGRVQRDERGEPMRLLGVSVDIIARKEAEAIAQQQRDELEQLRTIVSCRVPLQPQLAVFGLP